MQVKSILVNIFGGIVDCSIVANGITSAYKRLNVNVPVVVRLEGEALFNYYFLLIDKNNISSLIRTCLKLSRLFRSWPAPALTNCLIGWWEEEVALWLRLIGQNRLVRFKNVHSLKLACSNSACLTIPEEMLTNCVSLFWSFRHKCGKCETHSYREWDASHCSRWYGRRS